MTPEAAAILIRAIDAALKEAPPGNVRVLLAELSRLVETLRDDPEHLPRPEIVQTKVGHKDDEHVEIKVEIPEADGGLRQGG